MMTELQQITCERCAVDDQMQLGETNFFFFFNNNCAFLLCLDGHSSSGFSGWLLPECTSVCFPSQWLLYPAALCFMVFAQWHVVSVSQEVLAQVLCYLTGLQHTASFIMEISLSHLQQKPSVQSREKVPNFLFTSYLWYTTGRVEKSGHDTIILWFFLCVQGVVIQTVNTFFFLLLTTKFGACSEFGFGPNWNIWVCVDLMKQYVWLLTWSE